MKQVPLAAKIRTTRGSSHARRQRNNGFIPAEVYGHKEPNQSIEVSSKDLGKILSSAKGENIFFTLNIEGGKGEPVLAVIKEIQYNKLTDTLLHADFHKVNMKERIRIKVPIRVDNAEACEGVKAGGTLQLFLRSLEVQCLPSQIPDAIHVDALHFGIGHSVHVSDLKLPEGVKAVQSAGTVVISVAAQMAEEVKAVAAPVEGAAAPAAGAGEPEVITAKKKEEGEAAAKPEAGKAAAPAEKKPAEKK
ncbi:MAG TPA: 50S ribosomal protein L25 [bacterium]|nr:50S ribosomal protein L25 [bacterium]